MALFSGRAAGYPAYVAALVMLAMYVLGTLEAFRPGVAIQAIAAGGPGPPAFILEMPPTACPRQDSDHDGGTAKLLGVLKRAGTVIFAFSVVMWAATHYPKPAKVFGDLATSELRQRLDGWQRCRRPRRRRSTTLFFLKECRRCEA